jgi:hypothetical protein
LLLHYGVPTYYVSQALLAAAVRTELPDDMVFEAVPFAFDALVFMLPKGTVRHPTDGIVRSSSSRELPKGRVCLCQSQDWTFGLQPNKTRFL